MSRSPSTMARPCWNGISPRGAGGGEFCLRRFSQETGPAFALSGEVCGGWQGRRAEHGILVRRTFLATLVPRIESSRRAVRTCIITYSFSAELLLSPRPTASSSLLEGPSNSTPRPIARLDLSALQPWADQPMCTSRSTRQLMNRGGTARRDWAKRASVHAISQSLVGVAVAGGPRHVTSWRHRTRPFRLVRLTLPC